MFRILCDPSSGSTELCLTEITRNDLQIFCRCLAVETKIKKLKITPTCFGAYVIHHQGVQSCV